MEQTVVTVWNRSRTNEEVSSQYPLVKEKPPTDNADSQNEMLDKTMVENIDDWLALSSSFKNQLIES